MTAGLMVWLLAAMTSAAALYYLAVLAACIKFQRRGNPETTAQPAVSILKPVRGLDPQFVDNLCAHLEQDYPDFEVLAGAAEADDAALEAARRVAEAYPHGRLEVFVCPAEPGNRKVAILEELARRASHGLLLVDDADIRPSVGWLAETVAALQRPDAGLATCLYRTTPGATLGSKIDALWVSVDFPGQVLTAAELGAMPFALGATMLFRRGDLERIGGFSSIRPYLADDYQLGVRIAALGKRSVLSPSVVETVGGDAGLAEVWRRHLRWSRTVKASRRGGHLGLAFTFGPVWSVTLLVIVGWGVPLAWLAYACLLLRLAAAVAVGRTVGAKLGGAWLLLPIADLWSFGVWFASLLGNRVVWRRRTLRLDPQGRILPPD